VVIAVVDSWARADSVIPLKQNNNTISVIVSVIGFHAIFKKLEEYFECI